MSKIQNPNQKSNGFLWAVIALLVIVAAVVGFIVMQGSKSVAEEYASREREAVGFTATAEGDTITLASANASADAKTVDLYEDYSCPHCAALAVATDADMKAAIEDGSIVVNVRSLNFLDRGDDRTTVEGHSTKAGAAALAVARSGNAEAYWNLRTVLLEDQDDAYGQWDNNDLADVAAQMGADDTTVESIRNGELIGDFREVATGNADKLSTETGTVSSPRVFIDGTEFQGDINSWVAAATA
ncbi:thioredoxin domain-containing protein [Corynebacterium sp. 153RC1]|uniref:DsbA family protein n=1 Tax=unclassified Corynebacterium TaxID=2624378 RepID=UPI00211D08C5|nr:MULTISPECIES: thioredoxin domain-containing protein [unclassified Corynebacterium]MCQ9371399.1 thioredoxin domain-containing protein [Corynebacterium sp. 35RC1]MCQ9353478.1 thioredoxin domain-containing protein [Corynebacterium sp. 209RC1]MCQ9355719.1 thioredoxin domain-containing protein [Corynebacterium sp. 1222RC1]MCQ9357891.1 thioredoxin domain-containing protein [Corynebacterium sp. 122RC1]MCQ9360082.1 thioredoxin domain-containing protein [Corynebacterium sp. 142RC1]